MLNSCQKLFDTGLVGDIILDPMWNSREYLCKISITLIKTPPPPFSFNSSGSMTGERGNRGGGGFHQNGFP